MEPNPVIAQIGVIGSAVLIIAGAIVAISGVLGVVWRPMHMFRDQLKERGASESELRSLEYLNLVGGIVMFCFGVVMLVVWMVN